MPPHPPAPSTPPTTFPPRRTRFKPTKMSARLTPLHTTLHPHPCSTNYSPPLPSTTHLHHFPHFNVSLGHAADPNTRHRPTMEDAHFVTQFDDFPGLFVGVYDGHGGCTVANSLANHLHRYFLDALLPDQDPRIPTSPLSTSSRQSPNKRHTLVDECDNAILTPPSDEPMLGNKWKPRTSEVAVSVPVDEEDAFRKAYSRMDAALRLRRCVRVGATAVTCFLRWEKGVGRVLTTANCGDARAVLSRGGRPLRLSVDHRPAEAGEKGRVERGGGFVMRGRVNGVLNVSRAFGDFAMKSVVVATPAVRRIVLGEMDEFVVVACDGLWDFVDEKEVLRVVRKGLDKGMNGAEVARILVHLAMERKGTDNVTVVVLVLQEDE